MAEQTTAIDKADMAEIASVANELGKAYADAVQHYRREYRLPLEEADAKAREPWSAEYLAGIVERSPQQVSWWSLSTIAQDDPEAAYTLWMRVKQAARDELASGHRAALAVECTTLGNAWKRAQFLAVRAAFLEEWQPANGGESLMVDMLAQTYASYLFWLEQLQIYTQSEASTQEHKLKQDGYYDAPRLTTKEAIEQAAAMVDRFNRLFLRTLRALRDLRRYAPQVTIQNAGQVNIGAQQVNAAQIQSES